MGKKYCSFKENILKKERYLSFSFSVFLLYFGLYYQYCKIALIKNIFLYSTRICLTDFSENDVVRCLWYKVYAEQNIMYKTLFGKPSIVLKHGMLFIIYPKFEQLFFLWVNYLIVI